MPAPASLSLVGKSKAKGKGRVQVQAVASLEEQLQRSPADLNPISDLLDLLREAKATHAAAYALHRTFASLIRQGRLHGKLRTADDAALKTVREWLKARYADYLGLLVSLLHNDEGVTALTILFDLLRVESECLSTLTSPPSYRFADTLWSRIYTGLVAQPLRPDVRTELLLRYLNHFDDIRYYFLRETASQAESALTNDALALLEAIDSMPAHAEAIAHFWAGAPARKGEVAPTRPKKKRKRDDGSTGIFDPSSDEAEAAPPSTAATKQKQAPLVSLNAHRKAFGAAWLSVLPKLRSDEEVKRVLVILHSRILPHLLRPAELMDWLADCCDSGGTTALLALNGLFTLMTKHNLEYPEFYKQLYALLDRQVLHVRYRPRFFRMLDVFLSSTHLPATLVASFAKRLSRLSLSAPPAAIVTVVPFIYNLLKRHPPCMVLIHRVDDDDVPADGFTDPVLERERDPLQSRAIDSSLWELATLRSHHLAPAATLARVLQETFTKSEYDLEDFADHSWTTLFETETARQLRKPPALDLPSARQAKGVEFFPLAAAMKRKRAEAEDGGDAAEIEGWSDVVTELWTF